MSRRQAIIAQKLLQHTAAKKKRGKGFSLLELVVVVAVLAILAAIAVPAFTGIQEQAGDSAAKANLKNAYKECAYEIARGIGTSPTFDYPVDDPYYQYSGGSKTSSGRGSCVTAGATAGTSSPTVLTATKRKGTGTGGFLTINVVDGTKGSNSAVASVAW